VNAFAEGIQQSGMHQVAGRMCLRNPQKVARCVDTICQRGNGYHQRQDRCGSVLEVIEQHRCAMDGLCWVQMLRQIKVDVPASLSAK
jgi:hypothetical protein